MKIENMKRAEQLVRELTDINEKTKDMQNVMADIDRFVNAHITFVNTVGAIRVIYVDVESAGKLACKAITDNIKTAEAITKQIEEL